MAEFTAIEKQLLKSVTDSRLQTSLAAIREFQSGGGLVLTPDEFMAMLNPEFMIDWARPRLGSSDPALVQAEGLLRQGKYLESLLAVRGALRSQQQPAAAGQD